MQYESFADMRVLSYDIPNFSNLNLSDKLLIFYLSKAAEAGRDILWDQNYRHNLMIRFVVETILNNMKKNGEEYDPDLLLYAKRIWAANGIHHHYSNDKFPVTFSEKQFLNWTETFFPKDFTFTDVRNRIWSKSEIIAKYFKVFFDKEYDNKKVSLQNGTDLIKSSAVNFYVNVSQHEVEEFYSTSDKHTLNSTLRKNDDNSIIEDIWCSTGLYGGIIRKIIFYLEKASHYAQTEKQKETIQLLIEYYNSGNIKTFDEMNKVWVADKELSVDFINGFIEVYNDPLGLKATWESVVELRDEEQTCRVATIANNAQWFEDNSPVDEPYKKRDVNGVSMSIVNVAMLGGDCFPCTPIGINLPNADWIREQFGSKSVALANIEEAYHISNLSSGLSDEFILTEEEKRDVKLFGAASDSLHTQLHECLGHGSGQMKNGITLDCLKAYGSTIEEARADLYALYFMADEKMVELGLIPSLESAWTHYNAYMRNALLIQLARIEHGFDIEEAHMRNRYMIAQWVLQHADGACEMLYIDNKHYIRINDYQALRRLFGMLLKEIQRIKSEGDYNAARELIEKYAIKIDPTLHTEVIKRYKSLKIKPFSCFINPTYEIITDSDNKPVDVLVKWSESYVDQMLRLSQVM